MVHEILPSLITLELFPGVIESFESKKQKLFWLSVVLEVKLEVDYDIP